MSLDWPPALHAWPRGGWLRTALEPSRGAWSWDGEGMGVVGGEAKICWSPCQSARGWVLVALPG